MRRTRIKQKSTKTAARDSYYSNLRKVWLPGRRCALHGRLDGCQGMATDVHHIRGRGRRFMLDVGTWSALCRACHDMITFASPDLGKKLGVIESRDGRDYEPDEPYDGQCGACGGLIRWEWNPELERSEPIDAYNGRNHAQGKGCTPIM